MCSGLCKIKDTGDSMLSSSGQLQNIGCFFLTGHKSRVNKPGKKESTQCSWLSTRLHRCCFRAKRSAILAALQKWKVSLLKQPVLSVFIYPRQPGLPFIACFPSILNLPQPRQQTKKPQKIQMDNLIQSIRAVARNCTKGWWRIEKDLLFEMWMCCFIYHWLDQIKKP